MESNPNEIAQFKQVQRDFQSQYQDFYFDRMSKETVIIIPSLTLDREILAKLDGSIHYEERMLCLLMLLRRPNTHIIYLSSMPIHNIIMDYYLHLLPGITNYHARQRLTTLSCFDSSDKSLTQKILDRPRLIERIRKKIPPGHKAHLDCFNVTEAERSLALKLNIPVYGCDPDLLYLGTKSNNRKLFKDCGINLPPGFEDLHSEEEIIQSLINLKATFPDLRKAVIKLDEGFSGDGNAVYAYEEIEVNSYLETRIRETLPERLKIVATDLTYKTFMEKFSEMGGIVEGFVDGEEKCSPSVQCMVDPLGGSAIFATHDQVLGGANQQIFLGANFPANKEYAVEIGRIGKQVAEKLKDLGVIGIFSIDFISIKDDNRWNHFAIEINVRKGGTTHPYLTLQYLTQGDYDASTATYYTAIGQPRYYKCSDNLQSEHYKGLTPHDLIEISTANDLLYDGSIQEGVIFHMIGALSQYGKLGVLCIGATPEEAARLYQKTVAVLDKERRS